MYYLGVDGGGSKTSFVLITEKGNIAACEVLGTCHYKQVGFQGFSSIISQGVGLICDKAGISAGEISYSYFGLPGYGENIEAAEKMSSSIGKLLPGNFSCGNDSEAGWAGATGCKPGINIVSGTGAIVFGVDGKGSSARAGGWGEFCGDEGSAYWIARRLIGIFARQADGRLPRTEIYGLVRSRLKLDKDFDIIKLVTEEYKQQRDMVASLSKLASEGACSGDSYCIELFKEAAFELSLGVKAVLEQLDFEEEASIPVCCSGGVFKAGRIILEPLEKELSALSPKLALQRPVMRPDLGSAYYAWVIKNKAYNAELLMELKKASE